MSSRDSLLYITDILESIEAIDDYLKDFRNFIVHEYFGVNPRIIYDAATLELKELSQLIKSFKK